jgi:hypothetical protein
MTAPRRTGNTADPSKGVDTVMSKVGPFFKSNL